MRRPNQTPYLAVDPPNGLTDKAHALLERATAAGFVCGPAFQADPYLAALRTEPWWQALIGRVRGFEGATIEGTAEVRAEPGRLHVRAPAGELDGRVILRYHFAPFLQARPPARLEPVRLEDDPVPFIGLVPPVGETR